MCLEKKRFSHGLATVPHTHTPDHVIYANMLLLCAVYDGSIRMFRHTQTAMPANVHLHTHTRANADGNLI